MEWLEDRRLLSGAPGLTLTIAPASFAENAGTAAAIGTVTRVNTDDALPLTVNLLSSNISQAVVPASVVIPAGQTSATFPLNAVDDHIFTPTLSVGITATAIADVPLSVATTFGTGGSVSQNSDTTAVAVQPDGKIVTVGYSSSSSLYDATISRFNNNGTPDPTFGTNGSVTTDISGQKDIPWAVLVQPDGKIVVGGTGGDGPNFFFELARYNANGTLDTGFGNGGKVVFNQSGYYNEIWDLAIQSDGKILAGGDTDSAFAVARLNTNGSLDTSFGSNDIASVVPTPGYESRAFGIVVQSDGNIVLAGNTKGGNFDSQVALARFTPAGTLDSTFGSGGVVKTDLPGWYDEGGDVALQPDGKLIVAGSTSPAGVYPPDYNFALVRYNADGTLDSSFGNAGEVITDLGADDEAEGVVLQPDGMILVSGQTGPANSGYSAYHAVLARYQPNGTLDGEIISSTGGISGRNLAVAPDGEVFVAGEGLATTSGQLMAFNIVEPVAAYANVSVLERDPAPPPATTTQLVDVSNGTPASTALIYGQRVMISAEVSRTIDGSGVVGTVEFFDGTTLLGTATTNSNGFATMTTTATQLAAGTHSLYVVFPGSTTDPASSSSPQSFNVAPATLTVNVANATKVYGQDDSGTFTGTIAGLVGGESFATSYTSSGSVASANAGAYSINAALANQGTGLLSNYFIIVNSGTLTVTPAALTVTTNDASKVYGSANPAFTASYQGFVNGEDAASLSGSLAFATAATSASDVGSYPVTPSGLTSSNYTITFNDGTLSVTPAALTVTTNDASKVYGSANPAFTASYQGFVNGDTSAALGGSLAFATAATSASDVGSYPVTPSGLTSSNYAITFVDGTLTITKADQVITWNAPAAIVAGTPLGAAQLDAAVSVVGPAPAGALTYTPSAGTVLTAGNGQVLSVTAAATNDYNAATATVSIDVLPRAQYHFSGFLPPLDDRQVLHVGQTIPIKFKLTDLHGAPVTNLGAVASLQVAKINSDGSLAAPFNPTSSDGRGLRIDGRTFTFNWQTAGLPPGGYEIVLTLSDGSVEKTAIQLIAPHWEKKDGNPLTNGISGNGGTIAAAYDAVFQSLAAKDDELGDG